MIKVVGIQDITGRDVFITADNFFNVFTQEMNLGTFTFLGMTTMEIIKLRSAYMAKGGTFPVTDESVREAFGR